ncbi:hypothetical protein C8T65DRAFT_662323, partial [Cerioporus squamosus]
MAPPGSNGLSEASYVKLRNDMAGMSLYEAAAQVCRCLRIPNANGTSLFCRLVPGIDIYLCRAFTHSLPLHPLLLIYRSAAFDCLIDPMTRRSCPGLPPPSTGAPYTAA